MKKIGFYREYTESSKDPSVFELDISGKNQINTKILNYLKTGVEVCYFRNAARCRLSGEYFGPYSTIYTDGEWIWTSGLIFYVEKYNIKLPEDFLHTIVDNLFKVPSKEDIKDIIPIALEEASQHIWHPNG